MKQIISLSIVAIAFDTAEMRRMNRALLKCATDSQSRACNVQLLGMFSFVDQKNQLSNHRAYLESHGARFVFLRWLKSVSSILQDVDFNGSLLPLLSVDAAIMVFRTKLF